ncbi:MAG: sulfatase [Planctomycetota bacterium]|jgi:hypothetical protein
MVAASATGRGRIGRALEVAVAGAAVFGWMGLIEANLLCLTRDVPEPLLFLRQAALGYPVLGFVAGLLWGVLVELLSPRRGRWARQPFHLWSLFILVLLFQVVLHTHIHWSGGDLTPGSMASLKVTAAEAVPAVVLIGLAYLVCVGNRPAAPRPVIGAKAAAVTLGALLLVAALPWAGGLVRPRSRADVPNVLLIVLDTTRVDRLSAYGYDRPTTPALERIAAEGLAFRRAYAASPWTLPSHASMFTGEYAAVHNATWEHQRLDERLPTLAEHLSEMGLRTAAFSRQVWLSDETGLMRGFEDFYDLYWRSTTALVAAWRLGVDKIKERRGFEDKGAALVTDRFKGWIDRHGDRPFFAFINYVEPHAYYQPPAPFREQFLAEERKDTPWGRAQNVAVQRHNAGDLVYSADDFAAFSDLYDGAVAYQDSRMGEALDHLRTRGLLDKTLLLITADHGENLGDHDLLGHEFCVYNTLLHVPLIVRLPGLVAHRKGPVGPRSGSADPGRTAGIGAPRDRRGGRARFRGAVHASAGDGPVACFAASRAAHPPAQVRGAWEPEVHPGLGRGRGAVRRDRRPRGAEQPRRPSGRGPRRAARPPGGKGGNPGDGRGRRGSGLQRGAKAPPQVAGILGLNRSNVNMLE